MFLKTRLNLRTKSISCLNWFLFRYDTTTVYLPGPVATLRTPSTTTTSLPERPHSRCSVPRAGLPVRCLLPCLDLPDHLVTITNLPGPPGNHSSNVRDELCNISDIIITIALFEFVNRMCTRRAHGERGRTVLVSWQGDPRLIHGSALAARASTTHRQSAAPRTRARPAASTRWQPRCGTGRR